MVDKRRQASGNQRQKIIATASRLMSQKGYRGTSLQELADRVRISKSTLFHYFKNKEEILLEVLKISLEEVAGNLDRIVNDTTTSPELKLKLAISNHLALLTKYSYNVNVYLSDIRYLSPKKKREYLSIRKNYESLFEQIIKGIQETDKRNFEGMDSKIITFAILGMCNWVSRWFRKGGPFEIQDISDTFFKLIIQQSS